MWTGWILAMGLTAAPPSKPTIDKAIVRRNIHRNLQKIMYCYEKEHASEADLDRTLSIDFTIGVTGKVTSATATGLSNHNIEDCVVGVIKAIEFPRPKGGEIHIVYPLRFYTAGQ